MIKRLFAFLVFLILLFGLYVLGMILYNSITDYKPEEIIGIEVSNDGMEVDTEQISLLIWNVGFAGLGEEMDFFYDGGESVRPEKVQTEKYLQGILSFLQESDHIDIILLQEVDKQSKRSWEINEAEAISEIYKGYVSAFATNYKVKFVPVPFANPMGQVYSGLQSLSAFKVDEAKRYQFPGNYVFPKSIFFLDRCFLTFRYDLVNGKDLIIVNTHNSAYDDGSLKQMQMEYLKEYVLAEYKAGNYIVVGGDWNQCPPDFDCNKFTTAESPNEQINIGTDFLPTWKWGYDPAIPTNRKLAKPYDPETTFTTIIDFYLCSPNIVIDSIKTHDLDFRYSDHQPVEMHITLN